jgi:hypothetical protein
MRQEITSQAMRSIALLVACSGVLYTSGCGYLKSRANHLTRFREDDRKVVFTVPALDSPDCSRELLEVLSRIGAVKEAIPDLDAQQVTILYNSRDIAIKNIEYAIAGAGFDVDDSIGNSGKRAKLPEACR